jgi:hypothetical protein
MDKQLLNALDNLSNALDMIAESLKDKGGSKSDTTSALQSGNFIEQIKEISIGVQSIKKDTEEILKQQKTILEMSKKKESDKKTGDLESDPKKESSMKKGVASILLIAVAVLAIGMAFKLVGDVNFISVIGLGIAIVLVAAAFEKVAKMGMTPKEALSASLVMVVLSGGVLVSSILLSKVQALSIKQVISIAAIAVLFHFMAPVIASLIKTMTTKQKVKGADGKVTETEGIEWGTLIKSIIMVPAIMIGMSLGILVSSMILSKVQPITIQQGITSILISGVFALAAGGIVKLLGAFNKEKISLADALKAAIVLPLIMVGMSAGIWLSSMILGKVQPIGLMQAVSSILIAAVFTVAAYGMAKIIKTIKDLSPAQAAIAAIMLPLLLPAMSAAIWASSYFLSKIVPISFGQFITALGISLLFVVLSFGISKIIKAIGEMKWSDVPKIPVFFTLISLAIAASAFIFSKSKEAFEALSWSLMLKILVFGVIMGIIAIVFSFAVKIMGNIAWSQVIKLPIFFTLLSLAIATSAFIFFKAKEYIDGISFMMMIKLLVFGVVLAIVAIVLAIAVKIINLLGNVGDYIKGGLCVIIIAATVMLASKILNYGDYKNYPDWKWTLGVGLSLVVFGVAMVALGLVALTGIGLVAFLAGAPLVLVVAATIVATADILAKGKYENKGMLTWAISTALLFGTFVPIIIALGALGLAGGVLKFFGADDPFETAKGMLIQIAESIVSVAEILSKGKFTGGPTKEWAEGISIALAAFSPIYTMLMANGVMKLFGGGGVGPEEFSTAIVTVSEGILKAADKFSKSEGVWKGGPTKDWAEGMSLALGAFAPIYSMLMDGKVMELFGGSGVSSTDFSNAIVTISDGILTAAVKFSGTTAFEGGPKKEWSEGVGLAIGAFAPVYSILANEKGLFGSGVSIEAMKNAILTISDGIIAAAGKFAANPAVFSLDNVPKKEWGEGVGAALNAFAPVFKALSEDTGWFTKGDEVVQNMLKGIIYITTGLISSGKAFTKAGAVWGSFPSVDWAKGVSETITGYMGVFDEIGTREGGLEGFKKSSAMVTSIVTQMALTARILHGSNKFFSFTLPGNWISNVTKSTIGFAVLSKMLDSMLTKEEKITTVDTGLLGSTETTKTIKKSSDISIVARLAAQIVTTAKILYNGRKYFQNTIDPNYMKNVAINALDFARLANQLTEINKSEGFSLFSESPIEKAARGMITIANAYDRLAQSLEKFGNSINSIDGSKFNMIRRLTGNIAVLSSMDSVMFDKMLSTLENRASVFSKLIDKDFGPRPTVGDKKEGGSGKKGESAKEASSKLPKGKNGNMNEQLDRVIDLLTSINNQTSSLDEYLGSKGFTPGPPSI